MFTFIFSQETSSNVYFKHPMYINELGEKKCYSNYYHLPIEEVAKKLGKCSSSIKKERGMLKAWPSRKLNSLFALFRKFVGILELAINSQQVEKKILNDISENMALLLRGIQKFMSNPNDDSETLVTKSKRNSMKEWIHKNKPKCNTLTEEERQHVSYDTDTIELLAAIDVSLMKQDSCYATINAFINTWFLLNERLGKQNDEFFQAELTEDFQVEELSGVVANEPQQTSPLASLNGSQCEELVELFSSIEQKNIHPTFFGEFPAEQLPGAPGYTAPIPKLVGRAPAPAKRQPKALKFSSWQPPTKIQRTESPDSEPADKSDSTAKAI